MRIGADELAYEAAEDESYTCTHYVIYNCDYWLLSVFNNILANWAFNLEGWLS